MKVFLFDFDGVILDSFSRTVSSWNTALINSIGKGVSVDDVRNIFRNNVEDEIKRLIPNKDIRRKFRLEVYKLLDMTTMDFYDYIEELLYELNKVGELVIITSNNSRLVKECLEKDKVLSKLEVLGGDIEKSKAKKIKLIKERYTNATFVYVGDTTADIVEAKEAQVPSVAVTWGYHTKEWLQEENPTFIAETVDELRTILLNKFQGGSP